jgi:hypothetical protein
MSKNFSGNGIKINTTIHIIALRISSLERFETCAKNKNKGINISQEILIALNSISGLEYQL